MIIHLPAAADVSAQLGQHDALANAALRVRDQQAPAADSARRQPIAPKRHIARHLHSVGALSTAWIQQSTYHYIFIVLSSSYVHPEWQLRQGAGAVTKFLHQSEVANCAWEQSDVVISYEPLFISTDHQEQAAYVHCFQANFGNSATVLFATYRLVCCHQTSCNSA